MVAAAALALFVWKDLSAPSPAEVARASSQVTRAAARQHFDATPLVVSNDRSMVSRSATRYMQAPVQVPEFSTDDVRLIGWQPTQLDGRQSATFIFDVLLSGRLHRVNLHAVNLDHVDLSSQQRVVVGSVPLWIDHAYGYHTVTFEGPRNLGYVFSSNMNVDALVSLVAHSDLVALVDRQR
jgi:hypothetical protein